MTVLLSWRKEDSKTREHNDPERDRAEVRDQTAGSMFLNTFTQQIVDDYELEPWLKAMGPGSFSDCSYGFESLVKSGVLLIPLPTSVSYLSQSHATVAWSKTCCLLIPASSPMIPSVHSGSWRLKLFLLG